MDGLWSPCCLCAIFRESRLFLSHGIAKQPDGVNGLSGGFVHTTEENKLFTGTFDLPTGTGTVAVLITKQVRVHIKAGSLQISAELHFDVE